MLPIFFPLFLVSIRFVFIWVCVRVCEVSGLFDSIRWQLTLSRNVKRPLKPRKIVEKIPSLSQRYRNVNKFTKKGLDHYELLLIRILPIQIFHLNYCYNSHSKLNLLNFQSKINFLLLIRDFLFLFEYVCVCWSIVGIGIRQIIIMLSANVNAFTKLTTLLATILFLSSSCLYYNNKQQKYYNNSLY